MSIESPTLISVTPGYQVNVIFRGCAYFIAISFYPLLAMTALLPFHLPPKHIAYYVMYGISATASLALMHWAIKKHLNGCFFTLTQSSLDLGQNPKTVIQISDIVETLPIAYRRTPFRRPEATVSPARFNMLLLRLSDGARLPLAPVSNLKGFDAFFMKLYEALKPTLQENGELTAEEIDFLRKPNCVKVLQR